MTQEHPITPPPELVEQWLENTRSQDCIGAYPANYEQLICTQAARWGADQELQACCKLLELSDSNARDFLYSARRPKPSSLKEQALAALARLKSGALCADRVTDESIIRRAIESLPD